MAKTSALGKGLGALIDNSETIKTRKAATNSSNDIEIDKIEVNPFQPRTVFNEEALEELAQSIKELGIVQPLTVRKINNNKYQLIAGERRFRAAKIAGLKTVPVYIRVADDDKMLEMALVENIQRENLDAIEVAISYQRLMEECNLTQETLSERVGKKRSTVTNYLRLLRLPAEIQKGIRDKKIAMGHARALVNVDDVRTQLDIYKLTIDNDYSVRKVEELVRNIDSATKSKPAKKSGLATEYNALKEHLSKHFKTKIDLKRNSDGKGKIVIAFQSDDDLERILTIMDSRG